METADVMMQSHTLAPARTPLGRAGDQVRAFAAKGGRFWGVAGVVSLVLHASLPLLGTGRTVVPDERVTIELVSVPAPIGEFPVEPVHVDEPADSEIPIGPDAPEKNPLGAPVLPDSEPSVESAPIPDSVDTPAVLPEPELDAPAVDEVPVSAPVAAVDPEPVVDEPADEPMVEQPVDEPMNAEPMNEVPESAPKTFVRLPNLHRERGVPTRSVHPRVRRPPTKTRVASDAQRQGARGGKKAAPPAALREGEPDDIWACEVGDRGIRAQVKKERPITDWVTLLPTALFAYPTTPSLTDYLGGVAQVTSRQRRHVPRVGKWEFAMPRGEVEVTLEQPLGVRAYLGRDDARCLVGFESTKLDFFPMTLKRVPVRIVDGEGHEVRVLADVRFHKDARFELLARSDDETVPFKEGLLENASLIERTVDAHMGTAKTFSNVASFFGFDVEKMMVAEQKRRMKALRAREAQAASTAATPRR
jgi:hypothetical protein